MSSFFLSYRRALRVIEYLLAYLLVFFCVEAFFRLHARFIYELHGPFTADSPIYWAVGRGILNGFVPYLDLWESKPPGIFWLSALSYWLFDSMILGRIVQGLVLVGPAILLAISVAVCQNKWSSLRSTTLPMLGLIFGTLLGLYSGSRSGEFQVESFGAFFGIVYLSVIVFQKKIPQNWHLAICTIALALAIGFKEPFLLSCVAGALLLVKHPREIRDWIMQPIIFTAICGIVGMFLFGYLRPYVTIHLMEQLLKNASNHGSLLSRGLHIKKVLHDMEDYSHFLYLGIMLLGASFLYHRICELRSDLITALVRFFGLLIAIFLTALSVGIGGQYWNHHFIFALPAYAGLFCAFGQDVVHHSMELPTRLFILGIGTAFCLALFLVPTANYRSRVNNLERDEANMLQIAATIDQILDHCAVEQYLFLGSNGRQLYGYTKHSPLGPAFFQYDYMFDRKFFRDAIDRQLGQAQIIVLDHYVLGKKRREAQAYVEKNFTQNAWPCVQGKQLDTGRYTLLYRK